MPSINKRICFAAGIAAAVGYSFGYVSSFSEASFEGRELMVRKNAGVSSRSPNAEDQDDSLAIMISGQCHRFVYRDQAGPLLNFSQTSPPPKIDVYITLQCSDKPLAAFSGEVDTPPYMTNLNITDIIDWYHKKGANRVEVKILDDEIMEEMEQMITNHSTTLHRRNPEEERFDLRNNMLGYFYGRWAVEVRKFYSRHVVYNMTLQTQAYTGYVFVREDNFFLPPLDIDKVLLKNKNNTADQPFVAVDEHCEFGSYSDKMYVANKLGADMIFSSSFAQFLERMRSYVLFMYYNKDFGEPYQPEAFVHDSLRVAEVQKFDMVRVDVRYQKGKKCIPALYYYCMPEETKKLASQQGILGTCEVVAR